MSSSLPPRRADAPLVLPTLGASTEKLLAYGELPTHAPDGVATSDWANFMTAVSDWKTAVQPTLPWVQEELGAPLGAQRALPSRVSRNWGVLLRSTAPKRGAGGFALAPQEGRLQALGVAQARVEAFWQPAPEGWFLVLKAHAPTYFGLTGTLDFLAREQLEARCLSQLSELAADLLACVEHAVEAAGLDIQLQGNWDEATVHLQQKLRKTAVLAWAALHENKPAATAAQAAASQAYEASGEPCLV